MSFEIGVATDHNDFYDKLIAFLTTQDSNSAAESWDIVWTATGGQRDGIVLKGKGLADADAVYIGLRLEANTGADRATIRLNGMSGVIPAGTSFIDHINVSPRSVAFFLRTSGSMDYWFTMNGRRFMAAARVATVYECMYAGLFLPYSQPDQYGYPLFVGAMGSYGQSVSAESWQSSAADHTFFGRSDVGSGFGPQAYLLDPSGTWLSVSIDGQATVNVGPSYFGDAGTFDISATTGGNDIGYKEHVENMIQALGGQWSVVPFTLNQQSPGDQTFGVLDGCFRIGGRGQTVENIITISGEDYLVLQNAFRTSNSDYFVMQIGPDSTDSNS